ncbi:MAG: bacillithiol biosynthesis BshC [Acidobacteriota bacterium]|jgi:hypothetical protein|nr:bacillithiol biosynthesis BshC [Acidobacteriota bacterium]
MPMDDMTGANQFFDGDGAALGRQAAPVAPTLAALADALRRWPPPATPQALPQGSVAVLAECRAGLFGGALAQLLRCLTAAKVCAELRERGVDATPVCRVRPADAQSPLETHLVDRRYGLHRLAPGDALGEGVCGGWTDALLAEIEGLFPPDAAGGDDALASLKEAFSPGTAFVDANVRWLGRLLRPWGVVVEGFDVGDAAEAGGARDGGRGGEAPPPSPLGRALERRRALPVAVVVTEPQDAPRHRAHDGILVPIPWPRARVTMSSARVEATLRRYALDPGHLREGLDAVMGRVRGELRGDVPARLRGLEEDVGDALAGLVALDARDRRFAKARRSRGERILYQLGKLRRHVDGALARRERVAEARLRKACDFLAPQGRWQDEVLGSLQVPLRHGASGVQTLYEGLDVGTFGHQLIRMD